MKIPAAKAAADKEWEKLEKISAWNLTKVRSKKEVFDEARTKGAKVHFASLIDICHFKECWIGDKSTKNTEEELCFEETLWKMILDLMQYSLHKDHQHRKWRQQRSWDIISRLPGCAGQAADAVSAYTQVKMEDAPKLLKIPKSECPDIWICLPRHKWPKSWSSMEDPVVPLERNLYGHPLAGLLWERQFEKILLQHGLEKVSNWECLFVHREKGLFSSVYVDDIKLAGKKQNIDPMWKVLNKEFDLGEPTSFFDHVYLGCTQRQCEISKDIVDNYRAMFESRISAVKTEKYHTRIFSYFFIVLWHGRSCEEMCGAILCVSKQDDSTTLQSIYSMHRWPSLQRGRIEICRRIVKSMLSNCSEMLVLGTYWKARYSVVSEQTCTIDHEMDQSLWQTTESFDILHPSHMWT